MAYIFLRCVSGVLLSFWSHPSGFQTTPGLSLVGLQVEALAPLVEARRMYAALFVAGGLG